MSEIDTVAHELLGTIAGVQLYRPLSCITFGAGGSDPGVRATPAHLLLGGGSGEHPVLAADARRCVAAFLATYLLDEQPHTYDEVELLDRCEEAEPGSGPDALFEHRLAVAGHDLGSYDALHELLEGPVSGSGFRAPALDASHWGGDVWFEFVQRASQPSGWARPYAAGDGIDPSIESWIAGVVGEYVLLCYPEVMGLSEEEALALEVFTESVRSRSLYRGVMAFPAGYDREGGALTPVGAPNVRH